MIKVRTIGMLTRDITNPVLTSANAVKNYDFITGTDGETYLVANTITGDNAYVDDNTFAAGEYLNGHALRAWVGEQLMVDKKHLTLGSGNTFADVAKNDIFTIANGGLVAAKAAPQTGYYFVVDEKTRLTEDAVVVTIKKA